MDAVENDIIVDRTVAWWHEKSAEAGGACPDWSLFDPLDHPALLPWIALFKGPGEASKTVERDYLCTLCGEGLARIIGQNYKSRYFGELADAITPRQNHEILIDLLHRRMPRLATGPLQRAEKSFIQTSRVLLPFTQSGKVTVIALVIREVPKDT